MTVLGPIYAAILAHQGGWDEVTLILVPVAVIVLLLWLAGRRAAPDSEN